MPPPDEEEYIYRAKYRDKEWDLHRAIEKLMLLQDWTAPEFKQDSYVITTTWSNSGGCIDAAADRQTPTTIYG